MNVCRPLHNLDPIAPIQNLFLVAPDTEFFDFLNEIDELVKFCPEIIVSIEKDLEEDSIKEKSIRLADKKFREELTMSLPKLRVNEDEIINVKPTMEIGRPRMPAYLVYIFLMIRGNLGSLTSKKARTFMKESISLHIFLENHGFTLPGRTTIQDNVNCVSNATRNLIFDCQLRKARVEGLDDFKKLLIDSTSVRANSAWPTDAKMINGLVSRIHRLGQKLHEFGFVNFKVFRMEDWLKEMDSLEFTINLVAGKANSKGKLKKYYRQLLNRGLQAVAHLANELVDFEDRHAPYNNLIPSRLICLENVIAQMKDDMFASAKVMEYTQDRVLNGKHLKSTEKILSLSDRAAAFIKKGNRNPVIGYKPQLGRSGKGFVTCLIVPEGNAADSGKLEPATLETTSRTGVIPDSVNVDDGYASRAGVAALLAMGILVVSISGAKGKKLTPEKDWNSEEYQIARSDRSAVESLMFTLKYCFEFGQLRRTEIEDVRAELLEKVIAYNICRAIAIKQAAAKELKKAA